MLRGRWRRPADAATVAAALAFIPIVIIPSLVPTGAATAQAQASVDEQRDQAVAKARAGDLPGAIADLRALQARAPHDPLVAMDLAVLLHRAGEAKAATDVFEQAHLQHPPEYALFDMARAYRDQQRFDTAAALAETGARRFPQNPDWPVLQALILADRGHGDEALALLATPAARRAQRVDWLLAEAYAYRHTNRPYDALRDYMLALQAAPDNAPARREATGLLRELGAANGAAALNDQPPPLTTGTARRPLAADQAAAEVRWGGAIHPPDPRQRYVETDAALAHLDHLLAENAADPHGDPALQRRLRLDRVVALRDRQRMQEVVDECNALSTSPQGSINTAALPLYARQALADALLYLRRPKEAIPHYQAVVAADPGNLDARYGLFYAELEAEDFDAAYRTIDDLVAFIPKWRGFRDDPGRYPDPDYSSALVTAGLARLYGSQPAEAEKHIAPLAASAPASAEIRSANAAVMDARDQPRAAEVEAKIAQSLDPLDADIEKQLAGLDIERHRYAEAEQRIRHLQDIYPDDISVQRLAEDLDIARSAQLEIEFSPSWAHGGGANDLGNELALNARLWSPVIDNHWRVFALDDYATAHPEEGFVDRNRTGGGVELALPDVTATAYATYSTGEVDKPGGGGTIDWWVDDHLLLNLHGEVFSINTPLRALFKDVTADEVGGAVTYRWNEARELTFSAAYLPFTDGNQRVNGGIDFAQRLIDMPHFNLTGQAALWASSNTKHETDYYNPRKDLTGTLGMTANHILWRDYDDSWTQRISFDTGAYAQEDHGTAWIGTLSYEHYWELGKRTELHYGVALSSRVYDGDRENAVALTLGLNQRF